MFAVLSDFPWFTGLMLTKLEPYINTDPVFTCHIGSGKNWKKMDSKESLSGPWRKLSWAGDPVYTYKT